MRACGGWEVGGRGGAAEWFPLKGPASCFIHQVDGAKTPLGSWCPVSQTPRKRKPAGLVEVPPPAESLWPVSVPDWVGSRKGKPGWTKLVLSQAGPTVALIGGLQKKPDVCFGTHLGSFPGWLCSVASRPRRRRHNNIYISLNFNHILRAFTRQTAESRAPISAACVSPASHPLRRHLINRCSNYNITTAKRARPIRHWSWLAGGGDGRGRPANWLRRIKI